MTGRGGSIDRPNHVINFDLSRPRIFTVNQGCLLRMWVVCLQYSHALETQWTRNVNNARRQALDKIFILGVPGTGVDRWKWPKVSENFADGYLKFPEYKVIRKMF